MKPALCRQTAIAGGPAQLQRSRDFLGFTRTLGRYPAACSTWFASTQEKFDFYLDAAKLRPQQQRRRIEEEEEEACIEEKEAGDAFVAKAWNHPDFELQADNGRAAYTRAVRSVSAQLFARLLLVVMFRARGVPCLVPVALFPWIRQLPGFRETRG
eukprot:249820-Amphidinium_carterae.1